MQAVLDTVSLCAAIVFFFADSFMNIRTCFSIII